MSLMSLREKLTLKPIVSEVARLNDWLEEAFVRSAIQSSIAADLKLCLNEVVVNLISYAFADTAEPQISVEIELQAHLAKAEVRDNGTYFDIRDWPAPEAPKDLTSAQIGGYGILLIRDRASSIDYDRVDGVNRLRITCSPGGPGTERRDR
jgi:serine/threonine-protein kinase RsbW